MTLSIRLEAILSMLEKTDCLADIGCDHGFLPIEALRRGLCARAIACDLREGPLERAREHVQEAGLEERIDLRISNGLSALKKGEASTVVIAGMGGQLTCRILSEGMPVVEKLSQLVLSPQRDAEALRGCLDENGYRIEAERFIREDGKFYQIIRAAKRENGRSERPLAPEELRYGPLLLSEGDPGMTTYISSQITRMTDLLSRIDGRAASERAKARRRELEEELALLRRALARIRNGARGREVTSDDGDD